MTNEEMQAIRAIIQEELKPISERLDRIQEDVGQIREDAEITRGAVNALGEWAENVAVITAVTYPVKKAR